jgi:hypothetical protein
MQKSLDQMNVRLHRAVSDIDGVTGMLILRAIAGGERDAKKQVQLRDGRCSKSKQEIAEQLTGHWREDHLFSLQPALKMYDAVQERIAAYEQEMLRKLGEMEPEQHHEQPAPPLPHANKARMIKQPGQEAKRQALYRMSGVDITPIEAIGVETVEVVLREYGPDLSRFPTEQQFVSQGYPVAACAQQRGQASEEESGTAPVRESRLPCVWPRSPYATAPPWEPTIASQRNDAAETWGRVRHR